VAGFVLKGFNEAEEYGPYDLSNTDTGPDGKYMTLEVHGSHQIQIFHIPGKGKRDITMRTSDVKTPTTGPLYDRITVVQKCVSNERFEACREIYEVGGPWYVEWAFARSVDELYCIDGVFRQGAGYVEPPGHFYLDDGTSVEAFVGEWTLTFIEYND
jgi:hypothetical protein